MIRCVPAKLNFVLHRTPQAAGLVPTKVSGIVPPGVPTFQSEQAAGLVLPGAAGLSNIRKISLSEERSAEVFQRAKVNILPSISPANITIESFDRGLSGEAEYSELLGEQVAGGVNISGSAKIGSSKIGEGSLLLFDADSLVSAKTPIDIDSKIIGHYYSAPPDFLSPVFEELEREQGTVVERSTVSQGNQIMNSVLRDSFISGHIPPDVPPEDAMANIIQLSLIKRSIFLSNILVTKSRIEKSFIENSGFSEDPLLLQSSLLKNTVVPDGRQLPLGHIQDGIMDEEKALAGIVLDRMEKDRYPFIAGFVQEGGNFNFLSDLTGEGRASSAAAAIAFMALSGKTPQARYLLKNMLSQNDFNSENILSKFKMISQCVEAGLPSFLKGVISSEHQRSLRPT